VNNLLFLLVVSTVGSTAAAGAASGRGRPNFLLILVDNVGYGDLGCYGNARVKTPHIDRLAAEGVRCTDFYVASPSCTPSRAALLTGRHPERIGLNHQLSPEENLGGVGLPHVETIIPQYLGRRGYACGAFGKWNLGFGPGSRPTERGFDEFLGHASGNIHYFKHLYHGQNDLRQGVQPVDLRGHYSTDLFADAAIDFIRRNRRRPWFVYLPFNAVHFVSAVNLEEGEKIEWQVPDQYLALYGRPADESDEKIRFAAVVSALDDAIGRVLGAVDDLGQRENTVVLLISDNGAFMLAGRGAEVQSNRPLRGGGVTTYEGGIRVPALFRWPGRIEAGTTCREMLSSLDVLPMLVRAAGGVLPQDRVFDGCDPVPALAGRARSPHEALYWAWDQGRAGQWRAMRRGRFKLVHRQNADPWQLYDLAADMGETRDLADARPELVRKLGREFEQWYRQVHADSARDPGPKQGPPASRCGWMRRSRPWFARKKVPLGGPFAPQGPVRCVEDSTCRSMTLRLVEPDSPDLRCLVPAGILR